MLICLFVILLIIFSVATFIAGKRYYNMRREQPFSSGVLWGIFCGIAFSSIIWSIILYEYIVPF